MHRDWILKTKEREKSLVILREALSYISILEQIFFRHFKEGEIN